MRREKTGPGGTQRCGRKGLQRQAGAGPCEARDRVPADDGGGRVRMSSGAEGVLHLNSCWALTAEARLTQDKLRGAAEGGGAPASPEPRGVL